MKKFLSGCFLLLVISFPILSHAQNTASNRTYISPQLAYQIIDEAQPQLWSDMYKNTGQLMAYYAQDVLTIEYIDKYGFIVRVRDCTVLVLLDDL